MRIGIRRLVLLVYTIALMGPATARAGVIGLEWHGEIDSYRSGYESWSAYVPVGTEFSINFAIDTAASDLCGGSANAGLYQMASPATLSILGNVYTSVGFVEVNAPEGACMQNASTGVDFRFVKWQATEIGNPDLINFPLYYLSALSGYYGGSPGGMPGLPPSGAFGSSFHTRALSGDGTLTTVVPEPASLTLFGSGLVGLYWYARRRRGTTSM